MTSKIPPKRDNLPVIYGNETADRINAEWGLLTSDLSELKSEIRIMKFLYFLTGVSHSTWGRFGAIYYMEKGLTAGEIGLIEGVMSCVQTVSTVFWGYISDVTKRKRGIFIFTTLMGTLVLTMLAFDFLASNFTNIFLISIASQAFMNSGILDGWSFDVLGSHAKSEWGKIRLFQALSWGLGCFSIAFITDYYGFVWNFILYDSLAIISLMLMLTFITVQSSLEKAMGDVAPDRRAACQALCNGVVMTFLIEIWIMGIGVGVVEKLLYVYMVEDLGASTIFCGATILAQVSFEIPIFYNMGWLNAKFGYSTLMMVSQLCYVLRVWGYSLLQTETLNWIFLLEILHGFTFGLLWVAAKEYQRIITPLGWQGTFSTALWMIYGSVGKGAGAIVGGYLFDTIGARDTWKCSAALIAVLLVSRVAYGLFTQVSKCLNVGSNESSKKYVITV